MYMYMYILEYVHQYAVYLVYRKHGFSKLQSKITFCLGEIWSLVSTSRLWLPVHWRRYYIENVTV